MSTAHLPADPAEQMRQSARNALLLHALADVFLTLQRASISAIALKGAALLAARIVPMWARHLDDIDVWVSPADARRAWDALTSAGYSAVGISRSVTPDGRDSLDAPTHQLPMLRSPHGALVELHLESHACGDAGDFDRCHEAGEDVVLHGASIRVPSSLHLVEQLCGHVVVHHFGELRTWPRHLDDLRAIIRHAPELRALRGRPDEVGLSLRVLHGVENPQSADAILGGLFLSPSAQTESAWRVLAVAVRTGRFALREPRAFLRVLAPVPSHLRFTGDLDGRRSLLAAQVRRWSRIARRLKA